MKSAAKIPIDSLTPRQIVAELDKYIVGQAKAKRAVAIALRNRYRRQQLPPELRDEVLPKNILMIGPTGVGKTEIARRLAILVHAPFVKVEATKFTEVGYVGRDVDSMVRDLTNIAVRMVEQEKMDEVRSKAERRAYERLATLILDRDERPKRTRRRDASPLEMIIQMLNQYEEDEEEETPHAEERESPGEKLDRRARRRTLLEQLKTGLRNEEPIEIEVEESVTPFVQVFSPQGIEEMGLDADMLPPFGSRSRSKRVVTIAEAHEIFTQQEARKMIDRSAVIREAVQRVEQTGIIFLDEIDKIAGSGRAVGPDVSREGVQRDLLPIIEGSTVATKFGPVRTDHILFIAAGAFHTAKPSDLIPELQGRLPIRVELEPLDAQDFRRILTEPKNALTKQYQQLMATEGVRIEFTEDAVEEIARIAGEVNARTENIGARRLHTVMERLMEDLSFDAPDHAGEHIVIDRAYVQEKLADVVRDVDLSRYIL
ncbi:MAG: ATP-dependent protease ATPase subunit HslU [Fimbriimonadales bacterium]|nr:MAG: ATP-dependent protease ATPase subunit HslU [Fimbriimonadales bacterium]